MCHSLTILQVRKAQTSSEGVKAMTEDSSFRWLSSVVSIAGHLIQRRVICVAVFCLLSLCLKFVVWR